MKFVLKNIETVYKSLFLLFLINISFSQTKINEKVKQLEKILHINNVKEKSNCFWCTYDFNTPPVFIPRKNYDSHIEVYGCFCTPECAVGFLRNENLDSSTCWERYALLNNIYGKIFNYSENIKPAPNPHFTLNKFYGNLSIKEYRYLLRMNGMLYIIEKPITKVLPELHKENFQRVPNFNSLSQTIESNDFFPTNKSSKIDKIKKNI